MIIFGGEDYRILQVCKEFQISQSNKDVWKDLNALFQHNQGSINSKHPTIISWTMQSQTNT